MENRKCPSCGCEDLKRMIDMRSEYVWYVCQGCNRVVSSMRSV